MQKQFTGNQIRSDFIEYFKGKGHKFIRSSSLVPGGDQTLLFTNAGMVQFKDVFLGTDSRPYSRAVNSQKCMRVSGKHNDLDDVGRDDTHHTFFEMLGNWSFGDYYKKEAITWAWELLTKVWKINIENLWVTCFEDENKEIPTDTEAFENWRSQPGINPEHILFFGRKENFWEMANTGPCGPCSEIHIDRGDSFCDKKNDPNHNCRVNGDCQRFLELWNLVFIQYNRIDENTLEPLPHTHVDTGLGLERIVSVLQDTDSNYKTDLLLPLMDVVKKRTGQSAEEMKKNFTAYRVIADHARAAAFLIADGVVPGNVGRNYICRMIIRRAARFGSKIGLGSPFMSEVARKVVELYGEAYPELKKNKKIILLQLENEEKKFQSTVENGLAILEEKIALMKKEGLDLMDGRTAFELYATHGLPLEITKDILRESNYAVDENEFFEAMEEHRINSGAGNEFGALGGDDAEFYNSLGKDLKEEKLLPTIGIAHNPYGKLSVRVSVAAIVQDNKRIQHIREGNHFGVIFDKSNFYIESGGQVSDTGKAISEDRKTEFIINKVRKPGSDVIIHTGFLNSGNMKVGDTLFLEVNRNRRQDIVRNHTATHLLHAKLQEVLGDHVRQAGSLVAADKLRFDFTHPESLSIGQKDAIEQAVNKAIYGNYGLNIDQKPLTDALEEGATALFGEKYSEEVRTIVIGDEDQPLSYELCGGTHVSTTSDIGMFLIISESSAAAGIRRIEAVTGRNAYQLVIQNRKKLGLIAHSLGGNIENIEDTVEKTVQDIVNMRAQIKQLSTLSIEQEYEKSKNNIRKIDGMQILTLMIDMADVEDLRKIGDKFRMEFTDGIAILASNTSDQNVKFIVVVADKIVEEGYNAGKIAKAIAVEIGGSGGGRPNLAQAGGKDWLKLKEIFQSTVSNYINK